MSDLASRVNVETKYTDDLGVVHVLLKPGERVIVLSCDSGVALTSTHVGVVDGRVVAVNVVAERLASAPTVEDAMLAASQR